MFVYGSKRKDLIMTDGFESDVLITVVLRLPQPTCRFTYTCIYTYAWPWFACQKLGTYNVGGWHPLPPCVLRTALFWSCVLHTAIFWHRILRTVYQEKNNHFERFHFHKENKMIVCRISGVSWHTPVRTCVRWTTEIRKIEKP